MDSLPKLDTSSRSSSRTSYASTTDFYPASARSSITSISDGDSISSRTLYYSTPASLNRSSSFSRSSCEFLPESVGNTPISVDHSAPDTGSQCEIQDATSRYVISIRLRAFSYRFPNLGHIEPPRRPQKASFMTSTDLHPRTVHRH
jgi:hypothetical protein